MSRLISACRSTILSTMSAIFDVALLGLWGMPVRTEVALVASVFRASSCFILVLMRASKYLACDKYSLAVIGISPS